MINTQRRGLLLSAVSMAAGGALFGATRPAAAQAKSSYPDKPLRIVVPGPPGGATDILGRSLSVGLGKTFGQQVLVENKPGASGLIAAQAVLASPADGYTMYLGITSMIQLPAMMPKMPVDFTKDFAPVSLMAFGSDLLVVSTKLPAATVAEFVALAKSRPGKLSIGSYGNGTSSHLHGELLKLRAGIDLTHVPYKGAAPMLTDLLGGQLDAAFVDQSTANAQLKSDKLRFLAMTGTQAFKPLPQLRTLGDLGYAGFESNGFMAMMVAAGTPAAVVQRLSKEIALQIREQDVGQRLAEMGMQPVGSTPEELVAVMTRDAPRWARIVKDANIRME